MEDDAQDGSRDERDERSGLDETVARRSAFLRRLPWPALPVLFAAWGVVIIVIAATGGWTGLIGAAIVLAVGISASVWASYAA